MDSHSYSRLLSYIVCEISMPIKKHVYNFTVDDQISMSSKLISAAALTAKSQKLENLHKVPSYLSDKINMSSGTHLTEEVIQEEQELCEGTEIERSALGDILNYGSCQSNTNSASTSCVQVQTQSIFKRKSDVLVGNDELQPDLKKIKSENSLGMSRAKDCPDQIVKDSVLRRVNPNNGCDIYSDPLLKCSDSDFKIMYKVSRSTFQILIEILAQEELEPIENVPLHRKVLIVLLLLGSSSSYKDAAEVFEVSEEVVSSCFFDICATLYDKSENFIKWPTSSESEEIASRIETNFGFPGVVGVLGCQYFSISIPKESLSRREHFNGKIRMYCVALQIVCDDGYVIRDIFPGLPGGTRPAQVLKDSPLGEILTSRAADLIDPNKHILASSEFPQLTSMLTPYTKKFESLTKEEEEFNSLHEHVCMLADETFKMLKDRFRILKLLDPETATMVLVTTCVLHNICIQNGDTYSVDDFA